jgi:hypothetical protein
MLALFGVRRQSKLDKEDYKVFAADLEKYSLDEIDRGLMALVRTPRGQYETPFPEVAAIEAAIKAHRQRRQEPEGSFWTIYQCPHCYATQAGAEPARCHKCRTSADLMRVVSQPSSEEDATEYVRVNVADIIRRVMDKRRREGKRVWELRDERLGDAAEA